MASSMRAFAVFAALLFGFVACSSSEPIGKFPDGGAGGNKGSDAPPSPYCRDVTQPCTANTECCSAICDPATLTCAASINKCTPTGGGCAASTECCSMTCSGGRCGANACVADGQACTDSAACCGGNCSGGLCQPLNLACHTAGNPCATSDECCSKLCEGGVCKLGSSFCIQTGDVCSNSGTCCSGDCTAPAVGGTLGVCAPPPSGSTNCSDGVDGTVCDACNNCCSRLCAPYGPTGVKVCQPASGCRVNGDLCRQTSDCCGAAGTGLPGDGNVTCEIETGKALGICRNPLGCNPQGDVCHYKDYQCSISSARNDCCACISGKECCQLDFLGVPRCNALTACVPSGGSCSSTMDCCNQAPCVPDGTGFLRCYGAPPAVDGGVTPPSTCVPVGGPCSINADCCKGYTCIEPLGSTKGICGIPQPPSSTTDASVPDANNPGCAEYGQLCTTNADCCNNVPCSSSGRCIIEIIP